MMPYTGKAILTGSVMQRGLSLIELMVSITIGLLILVSLSSMFINQSRARSELDKANRMIDNGRYALGLLSESLQVAGYFGSYGPTGTPAAVYDPCATANITDPAINNDLMLVPVEGYDAASWNSQVSSLPSSCGLVYSAGSPENVKDGSDILVIRRLNTSPVTQAAAAATGIDGTIYMQISSCQYDTTVYKIDTNPANLTLGQRNITGSNNCHSAGGITTITAPYADLRAFIVEAYFVSPDNNPGDGIPTLKRRELTFSGGAPTFKTTPLVEGIEYMQVEYGIDANLDGAPDSYSSCSACTAADWANVTAVHLYIVARNTEATTGYTDANTYSLGAVAGTVTPGGAYKRHAYTQTVRLNNPAGRRDPCSTPCY